MMRHTIEVTRETGRSVTQDLGEMGAWLKKADIQAQTLRAKQILHGRVVSEAVFDTPAEADRFMKRFDFVAPRLSAQTPIRECSRA